MASMQDHTSRGVVVCDYSGPSSEHSVQLHSGVLQRMQTYTTVKSENEKKKALAGIAVDYMMVIVG